MAYHLRESDQKEVIIEVDESLTYQDFDSFFDISNTIGLPSGPLTVTFDLKNVSRIDSLGLGLLYNSYVTLRHRAAYFKIINANESVSRAIKVGCLNRQFSIDSNLPQNR